MSKLGRYSADRKKVASLTAATKTIQVAECGTVFALNRAGGVAITLPSLASAGDGWWCKIVVQTLLTSNMAVTSADGAGSVIGSIVGNVVDASPSTITHDGEAITLAAAADVVGDQLELVVVNSKWVLSGICST